MSHVVLPTAPKEWSPEWGNLLIHKLQQALDDLSLAASSSRWIVSPAATPDRTINPTSESTGDVRQILATLIEDLRTRGVLG